MDDHAVPQADVDQWLSRQHSSLIEHLATTLDLGAGLRDATLPSRHQSLIQGLRDTLDLEVGLTAVIDRDATPDLPEATALREEIRGWASSSPSDRLDYRTHTALPYRSTLTCGCVVAWRFVIDAISAQLLAISRIVHTPGSDTDDDATSALSVVSPLVDDLIARIDSDIKGSDDAFYSQISRIRDSAHDIIPAFGATRGLRRLHDLVQRLADDLDALELALNDFTAVDMRGVDLTGANLMGLRWSNETIWPEGWTERIRDISDDLGSGVFVVRGEQRHD
jgi:hypothetical protein